MTEENGPLVLNIEVSSKFERNDLRRIEDLDGRIGDFLTISRRYGNQGLVDFEYLIDKRTVLNTSLYDAPIERYESIELNGDKFSDVISFDISIYTDISKFKYYYNAEVGLIGFVDLDNVLWTIQI